MSIVCAAIKNKEVAISCDTVCNFGSINASARHIKNSNKLYAINGSIMGIVGWSAVADVVEHLISTDKELFKLNDRMGIFTTLTGLHKRMKETYGLETRENEDQPVESTQLDALVINQNGLFEISSYRDVREYKTFWALGSGQKLGLGAMHALYDKDVSAKDIVEAGVKAAADFDDGCGLPLKSKVISMA